MVIHKDKKKRHVECALKFRVSKIIITAVVVNEIILDCTSKRKMFIFIQAKKENKF